MEVGETLLFFGCYHHDEDYLYKEEYEEYENTKNFPFRIFNAFSHDQKELIFVQHRMLENAEYIWNLMDKQNAVLYVCG
jgi:sulfite reductase (NADPH) flavoprotein alpha-component